MGSWTWFEAAIVRGLGGDDIINAPDEAARAIEGSSHPAQNSVSTTASSLPSDVKAPHQVRNPVDGSRVWMLQRNRRANPFEALHEIIWRKITAITESDIDMNEALDKTGAGTGVGFVDQLQPGDRIAIYARAQVMVLPHRVSYLMPQIMLINTCFFFDFPVPWLDQSRPRC